MVQPYACVCFTRLDVTRPGPYCTDTPVAPSESILLQSQPVRLRDRRTTVYIVYASAQISTQFFATRPSAQIAKRVARNSGQRQPAMLLSSPKARALSPKARERDCRLPARRMHVPWHPVVAPLSEPRIASLSSAWSSGASSGRVGGDRIFSRNVFYSCSVAYVAKFEFPLLQASGVLSHRLSNQPNAHKV